MMDMQQLFSENVNEICYLLLNARYSLSFMSWILVSAKS